MVDTGARYRTGRENDGGSFPRERLAPPRAIPGGILTDGIEEERPGLQDIPRLVKSLIERAIDLGSARLQLAQLELKVEVRQRIAQPGDLR